MERIGSGEPSAEFPEKNVEALIASGIWRLPKGAKVPSEPKIVDPEIDDVEPVEKKKGRPKGSKNIKPSNRG